MTDNPEERENGLNLNAEVVDTCPTPESTMAEARVDKAAKLNDARVGVDHNIKVLGRRLGAFPREDTPDDIANPSVEVCEGTRMLLAWGRQLHIMALAVKEETGHYPAEGWDVKTAAVAWDLFERAIQWEFQNTERRNRVLSRAMGFANGLGRWCPQFAIPKRIWQNPLSSESPPDTSAPDA